MSRPLLAEYVHAGWALVPIPIGRKGPIAGDWNLPARCITDPEIAEYLDGNVGLAHAYSGTCAIDIDDFERSSEWLGARGVDLGALWNAPDAVRLSSGRPNRGKLIYRIPEPTTSKKVVENKANIIDFRCATRDGMTVQDVLPPSIHPDTGKPYVWEYGDDLLGDWRTLPMIPDALLAVWKTFLAESTAMVPVESTAPRVRSLNLGQAREYLFRHDPDCDRDQWVKNGMTLHDESQGGLDGLDLWDEWSRLGKKYKSREELETIWRSFHTNANNPLTIASLRIDEPAHDDEFSAIKPEETAELPKTRTSTSIREAINSLRRDEKGRPFAVLSNILPILALPDVCGQQLAYDSFKDVLICAPKGTKDWRAIKDTDYTAFRVWLEEWALFHPVSKDMARDAIYYIAEEHKMDSAQDWLSSLVWDGVPRIRDFFPKYMGTIAAPYEWSVGEYLWTALAGRIMKPGCQADMAVIIVGEQGLGKSSAVQAIAPWHDAYAELRLDENDDNIARKLRGAMVAEIAELRGFSKVGELERIKAFMTRRHEKWVPKYMEFATDFPRRCICIGTTNEDTFLVDDQNRRWLPLRTAGCDVEAIIRDRDQLWAEGLALWLEHGIKWEDAETLAKDNQDEYKVVDQWQPVIEQWFADNPEATKFRTHDILSMAVGLDPRHITRVQEQRVCSVLKTLGYQQKTLRDAAKKTFRGWVKKELDI